MQCATLSHRSLSLAAEQFFNSENPDDFDDLLAHYTAVETISSRLMSSDLVLLHASILDHSARVVGQYPAMFAKHYGVVSMVSLIESKLVSVKQYRESLMTLLVEWEFASRIKREAVLTKIEQLSALIERDQSVKSTGGVSRTEDLFVELLRNRNDDLKVPFTFELTALNRNQLAAAVAGFKNAATIPLRLDPARRDDEVFLEHVAMCLEGLAKKITLSTHSLRLVREFIVSSKGL